MEMTDRANASNGRSLHGASTAWQNAVPAPYAQNAPKEIGIMARVDGLNNGLQELEGRLQTFCDRIGGNGSDKCANPCPMPCGIPQSLTIAESHLRECLKLIGMLNEAF